MFLKYISDESEILNSVEFKQLAYMICVRKVQVTSHNVHLTGRLDVGESMEAGMHWALKTHDKVQHCMSTMRCLLYQTGHNKIV